MPLVNLNDVLIPAYNGGYAVPGFNFHTYEDAEAIVKGAEFLKSPVILMASGSCIRHLGLDLSIEIVKYLAKNTSIPVVAHLDHATDINLIFQAMAKGFTSVMYDGSLLDIEKNIKNTKLVVKVAHALGINVEAEIGRVGKSEEGEEAKEILTDPEIAKNFFDATQVDALAVAVGTAHAMQKQEANIRFDLVEMLSNILNVPLVLHGSSGVKNEDLIRISKTKFSKVNIGTILKTVYIEKIREILNDNPELKDQIKLLESAANAVVETVKEKIRLLGSDNKV
ncbi:class II fructose-bisphosphate aldolase [Petrotoga halophila]|uniref:Ketose-bisphosphate aldolase n=1 Tax=Petrotoga halophila DSM 16923 TaxID=1122953 RepID=A0A2S5E916_9BACT|nr:class II fructose-bisphosphate aldolase [Petrotoga halophila]POZ89535.1 ketose-bisphosphate aldolase [Petrotoga halophila DSM 16923]